ncbi:transmembrane protein 246 [Micropterus salmoides]|uniref:transmembrane protein 246 n=1 Tax=Micropterus salmoides TaxID=27706 RepID=UPI0018EA80CC|nr:transmembrane protein 246 [Micropterus salmoides]XP_038570724.1 transmembrane protein 246 [Micropterus salmoides]XP_038570725.1 transmembrane protein 246 [Micropterus salmoides]XP_038570726.1 transmembrane protein 246 [Micropterus salmoides]XP_038570727.1 transmembrane protein 246 [Micropterus salmoides]XP_038570728.1 transmembrane protein 246 [Micropterus salmoides]
MPRWKAFFSQRLRWSSTVTQALVLSVITFGVLLPLCCHRLLYSYFFIRSMYLDSMSEGVLRESLHRGQDALHFFQSTSTAAAVSAKFRDVAQHPELLVTVVTARRNEGRDFHYLLQVMRQLSAILGGCGERRCAEVLVCDVESGPQENQDAKLLESHFKVIRRSPREQLRNREQLNTFEREKRDYVFCLRKGWQLVRPRNMVVLEDDALPTEDFFTVIKDLLSRRFALQTLYIKLYHPERLQRYWNPEPYRILEWVGLGLVGATALLLTFPYWNPCAFSFTLSAGHLLFFTLYFMAVAELLGRHYLLEARRFSPQLYAVSPATECCTPAMLFPGNASLRVAEYLDGSFCVKGNAKDMVLYQMARTIPGERSHSVEPNLITHIGAYSSVRANPPRPKLL